MSHAAAMRFLRTFTSATTVNGTITSTIGVVSSIVITKDTGPIPV